LADEVKKEFTITRIFDASRDLVWKAWTDQTILQKWWGPRGVTNPICWVYFSQPLGWPHRPAQM